MDLLIILYQQYLPVLTSDDIEDWIRAFWKSYQMIANDAFRKLECSLEHLPGLAPLIEQLMNYQHWQTAVEEESPELWESHSKSQRDQVAQEFLKLVQRQWRLLIQKHHQWSFDYWYRTCNGQGWNNPMDFKHQWEKLSPHDWSTLLGSLLLTAGQRCIYETLGPELMILERNRTWCQDQLANPIAHLKSPSPGLGTSGAVLRRTARRSTFFSRRRAVDDGALSVFSQNTGLSQGNELDSYTGYSGFVSNQRSHLGATSLFSQSTLGGNGTQGLVPMDRFSAVDGCPSMTHALTDGSYMNPPAVGEHSSGIEGSRRDPVFVPHYPRTHGCLVQVVVPEAGLADTKHWGHLAWQYDRFATTLGL